MKTILDEIEQRHEQVENTVNWHGSSNVGKTAHDDRGRLIKLFRQFLFDREMDKVSEKIKLQK